MEHSTERPRANADPPDLNNPDEILRALLCIEWGRLETAKKIEQERSIVFPETTIIIRDILKLMTALGMNTVKDNDRFMIPDLE